jgi:hypothetical protein
VLRQPPEQLKLEPGITVAEVWLLAAVRQTAAASEEEETYGMQLASESVAIAEAAPAGPDPIPGP